VAGPAKWAAVGAMGGAAITCVIVALVLRQPRDLVAVERAPIPSHAFVQRSETPPSPSVPVATPVSEVRSEARGVGTSPPASPPLEPAKSESVPPSTPPTLDPSPTPWPSEPPAPSAPAPKPAPPAIPKPPSPSGKLNVNKATQAELELLPGIGPAMAKRIVDYRTAHGLFKRLEDLDKVNGIGPKTLDKLRPLVTVE
jgi:competence protein ComEA